MKKGVFQFFVLAFVIILTAGCGIKRERPDDVKLIKSVIDKFQTAVNLRERSTLDSLYWQDELSQKYSIPKLFQDFSDMGDLQNIRFTARRFEIFEDSAAVFCTLLAEDVKLPGSEIVKRPFEINLGKQKKRWRIIGHKLR
jgi:ketosteroid isomerase-like protein